MEPIVGIERMTVRDYAKDHLLPNGSMVFQLREGDVVVLHYKPFHDGPEKECSVSLPPGPLTLEDVRQLGCAKIGLNPADIFMSTKSGIALLDTSSEFDSYHMAEGLCLCDLEDMLRVTVNENFAVGFTRSSKPNAELLLTTMGMPEDVFICFDDVVLPNDTLLVPDGSYNVVELPSEDFRQVKIVLPSSDGTESQFVLLDAFVEATVGSLLRAAEQRIPTAFATFNSATSTAFLVDNTGCILDFALPIYMIPVDCSELKVLFV